MSGFGHNNGPAMDRGISWRTHCWTKARRDLIPHLPIEILRSRVKRAREIGLDYTTYASVRASTGHDVIGFLFSSNALQMFRNNPVLPAGRREKLTGLKGCRRIALASLPLTPTMIRAANPAAVFAVAPAPEPHAGWSATRQAIRAAMGPEKLPGDGILLIGDTTLEREWATAGRLAGYLPAERYFQTGP